MISAPEQGNEKQVETAAAAKVRRSYWPEILTFNLALWVLVLFVLSLLF